MHDHDIFTQEPSRETKVDFYDFLVQRALRNAVAEFGLHKVTPTLYSPPPVTGTRYSLPAPLHTPLTMLATRTLHGCAGRSRV